MLAHYNEVIPEGADRIFAMAEKNGEHRRSLETFVVHAEHKRSMWGLVCGLLIVLSLLLCGTVVTLDGHPEVGIAIVGMDILGVTGSFIYGTESRRRERLRRAEIMTGRR